MRTLPRSGRTLTSARASSNCAAVSGEVVLRQSSLNQLICSSLAPGTKRDVNTWRNVGLSLPQPETDEFDHCPVKTFLVRVVAVIRSARVAAVKYQMGDALRIFSGVSDTRRRALRDAEQRERFPQVGCRDDRVQILNPPLEGRSPTCQSVIPQPRSS